jgi:hypothetical protein
MNIENLSHGVEKLCKTILTLALDTGFLTNPEQILKDGFGEYIKDKEVSFTLSLAKQRKCTRLED